MTYEKGDRTLILVAICDNDEGATFQIEELIESTYEKHGVEMEIDIYYSNYDWYNKYYSTCQLMNFLRVIQYAKEERTVAFLKNVLNSIL